MMMVRVMMMMGNRGGLGSGPEFRRFERDGCCLFLERPVGLSGGQEGGRCLGDQLPPVRGVNGRSLGTAEET